MARHAVKKSLPWRWIVIGTIVALAATAVGLRLTGAWGSKGAAAESSASASATTTSAAPPTCTSSTALRVSAASGIAAVVQDAAKRECIDLTLTKVDTAAGAAGLADGSTDVWIPDSRAKLLVLGLPAVDAAPSAAVSPIVMSVPEQAGGTFTASGPASWGLVLQQQQLAPLVVQVQDAKSSSTGLLLANALSQAAQAALGDRYLALGATAASLRDRPVADPSTINPSAIQIGEQRLQNTRAGTVELPMKEGVPYLDYPVVVAPTLNDPAVLDAAKRLTAALTGDQVADARKQAGLLPPTATSATVADTEVPLIAGPSADQLPTLYAVADSTGKPGNTLAVVDISGSMGQPTVPGGPTRMDVARSSGKLAISALADATSVGLWEFGYRIDGAKDHKELVQLAPLAQNRAALNTALDALAPRRSGTSLYRTVLEAYLAMQQKWDPARANTIAIFTDGKNEDAAGGLNLNQLTTQLAAAIDPNRPIQVVLFGYGEADIPAMDQISAITGGKVYAIAAPEQIIGAFIDAIAASVLASLK